MSAYHHNGGTRYVNSRPAATGYHLAAWATVFNKAFGHETRYLAAEAGGEIVGILPLVIFKTPFLRRFIVSLPFVNYGGVVADSPEAERALIEAAIAETGAVRGEYLELRHTRKLFPSFPSKEHKVEMILPLAENEERQWTALDRKIRNQVRKAEKSQLQASHGGLELLDAFYDVFAHNMRDLGTPAYGKALFRQILSNFPENSANLLRPARRSACRRLIRVLARRHDGGAIGVGAPELQPDVPEHAPVLGNAAVRHRARIPQFRFRPLDAWRRYLRLQAPMGSAAAPADVGILARFRR